MLTKVVENLPKIKVYHLHIKIFGKDDVYVSSLSCQKLSAVLDFVQQNEDSKFESFRIFETMVANTYESDDNHVYDTLSSFRNFI
jgi:hypothetical protein